MRFYWLIVGILAVWRVTHLLNAEDGPWDSFVRFRRRAGSGFWGKLLDCFYCLSLWVAAPPAYMLGDGWKERLFLWLALSGGAILLERLKSKGLEQPPAYFVEDQEEDPNVLRQQQTAVSDSDGSRPSAGGPDAPESHSGETATTARGR